MQNKLRKNFIRTLLAVILALVAVSTATFAWYSFNASSHTTELHMAAGSTMSLSISNAYDGIYGLSTQLSGFNENLIPVSTDRIQNGFQKVEGFTKGESGNPRSALAHIFSKAGSADYYKTTLFIKSTAGETKLYLQNIGFVDADKNMPLSTAARIGLVVHEQGQDKPVENEFIFEINDGTHEDSYYNTEQGVSGDVLDSTKTDGSTVTFTPYNSSNFCGAFNSSTGTIEIKPGTVMLSEMPEADIPVQIDVYIWLEGCDPECTDALLSKVIGPNYIESISLAFAGDLK